MIDAYILTQLTQEVQERNWILHQVAPVKLASKTLKKLQERNHLNTSHLDDVLGCSPFEQGLI